MPKQTRSPATGQPAASPAVSAGTSPVLDLRVLDSRSKAERVADAIEGLIRGQELAAGAFLGTKSTLRQQMGVSPATLDTALGVLTDRGLIELRPGVRGGVRVADAGPSLFLGRPRWPVLGTPADAVRAGEAMTLYLSLQSHVVARSTGAATGEDRKALRAVRTRLRRSIGDPDAYAQAHLAAHHALLDSSHDEVLTTVVRGLMSVLDAGTGPARPPSGEEATDDTAERVAVHVAVIDAVLARDLDAAWAALLDHGLTPGDVAPSGRVLPPGALDHQERWARGVRSAVPSR